MLQECLVAKFDFAYCSEQSFGRVSYLVEPTVQGRNLLLLIHVFIFSPSVLLANPNL